ncbi:MAG: hypothetical protein ACI9FW_000318 [Flavobacterium sp.]|jgi:hypothetical protein
MKQFILKYHLYGLLLLLCTFYIFKATKFPVHDFANYYFGAQFLADGNFNNCIYFPYEFNKAIADLGFQNIFVSFAPNTPFLAVCFLPLILISVAKAKIIFNIISSILFIFSCYRLFDFYKINRVYILLIALLFFVPIKNNLLFGQLYFLLFFLLSEGLIAFEKQRFKSMSLFLSLAILLKVFPILFVLIFVFKKQFKPLFYTFGFCVLLFGISLLFTGIDIWVFFFKTILLKASNGEIATSFVDNYQSVFMFLKRLLLFDATENYTVLFSSLILVFKFFLILIGFYVTKGKTSKLYVFSYWVLASFLISPYGSTYGFILMLFVLISILKSSISNIQKSLFVLLLFLINNLPLSYFIENDFPFSYLRLFFLILFFVAFIYQINKTINWKTVIPISALPMILLLINTPEKINSEPFSKEIFPILVYDYEISNNQLTYSYWNEKGENTNSVSLLANEINDLVLINNQIYYNNKQLTFDKSNKLKPTLINHKTILFLSDYDRGVGFYTFRKIVFH